jgi:transcriptional regulator with XRE-family HTH domain
MQPPKYVGPPSDDQTDLRKNRLQAASADFARRLHAAMLAKGWNQADLARAAWNGETRKDSRGYEQPIGKDRISVYLKGRVLPDAQNLKRLADALGTGVEELAPVSGGVAPVDFDNPDFVFSPASGGKILVVLKYVMPAEAAAQIMALIARLEGEKDPQGSPPPDTKVQFLNETPAYNQ